MPICGPSGLPADLPLDTMQPRECVEFVYSLVRAAAASLICSRKAFRPTLFVARQAFRARSRKALSDGATTSLSRASSSHPAGLPWCCSICRRCRSRRRSMASARRTTCCRAASPASRWPRCAGGGRAALPGIRLRRLGDEPTIGERLLGVGLEERQCVLSSGDGRVGHLSCLRCNEFRQHCRRGLTAG